MKSFTQHIADGNLPDELEPEQLIENAPTINTLIASVNICQTSETCEVSILELNETYNSPSMASFIYGEEGDGFIVSEFEVQ